MSYHRKGGLKNHNNIGQAVYAHGSRKSKSKIMLTILGATTVANTSAQAQVLQAVVTTPMTIGGLRWNLQLGTTGMACNWAIVVQRGSNANIAVAAALTAGTMITGTTAKDVMIFGTVVGSVAGATNERVEGQSKTMRKLNVGDALILYNNCTGINNLVGTIQFFQMI